MRNLFILVACCLLSLATSKAQQPVRISGRIKDYRHQEVQFNTFKNYVDINPVNILAITKTDGEGFFAATFDLSTVQPITFSYGGGETQMRVLMSPSDSMFIDVRNPAQSSVSNTSYHLDKGVSIFSGDGASVNNYLFEASLSLQGSEIVEAAKHRSLEDYHSFLDSMQQARIALKKETIYDARIEEYLFGEIVASTFYHKSMYLAYSRKSENTAMQANDPARDKFWKEWGFLSDEALISAGYREGLTAYFNKKASLKEGPVTDDRTREKFFAAAFTSATSELMDRPNTREYMTAFFLYHMLTFVERADSAVVLASRFYETFPESVYYPAIEKKLQLKRKISHVAPDIYGVDTTSRSIRIADLKGKVLYIDVWASWCGPCIQEFRNSKKLADKFKDREVCFVYLNIDDTDQAWRRMIGVKKMEGIHIRADKEAANEIKKNYGISSIPRYILIDKEGNLVSASAKRPSDVESDISRLLDTK